LTKRGYTPIITEKGKSMPLYTEFIMNQEAYEDNEKIVDELDALFTDDDLPDETDKDSFLGIDTPIIDPRGD
jgi:hypothetical protein